ncbi:MAG: dienelactone hydrolase family protein [Anaerolineales bacterium]|nr:MAG: dienelactone hydrolase family protein [Anaerolineales bacterium]
MTGEMMMFPIGTDKHAPAYLSLPPAGSGPAVVIIQEWWGLVGHIKDVADRLAAEGFVVLAPDLYHGASSTEPDEARKLAMALDRHRAIAEITAAADYLRTLTSVDPKKVGIMGWCMGGALALSAAAHSGAFDAVVCFYGRPLEAGDAAKLRTPTLGIYGELDTGIPLSLVQAFDAELEKAGTPHHIHTYAGAEHAFFNNDRPEVYHPEASADAWQRTLAWLRQYLA